MNYDFLLTVIVPVDFVKYESYKYVEFKFVLFSFFIEKNLIPLFLFHQLLLHIQIFTNKEKIMHNVVEYTLHNHSLKFIIISEVISTFFFKSILRISGAPENN